VRDRLHGVWEFPGDTDLGEMVRTAQDQERDPDLRVQLLASAGETVTVEVVDGRVPVDPDALHVQDRGACELARRETWPGGRVLLLVMAWPRR
jgi:hypothetical protein